MKRFLFFCCIFAAFIQISAQSSVTRIAQANSTHSAATMASQERNSSWLTWASNIDDGVITTAAMNDIIFAQRFTTSDLAPYNGFQLTQIAFYVENNTTYPPSGTYTVKVYQGGSYTSGTSMSPGTLVCSQTVTSLTYDDLTYVTLNNPVTINASQELWFGVEVSNISADSYMMGFDNTSTNTGKGALYYDEEDMAWYDINSVTSLEISAWAIEAYALDPNGETDPIIDLGIWFIDNITDQNEITSLTVPYGSDFTPIPVVYNYNYGDATDNFQDTLHFDLTLDGSPLGSTGASTVYIASGNGVYWDSYNALYASDIANYNLYGTHTFCMTVSTGPGWYENDASDNTGCLTVTFEGPATTNPVISVVNTDGTVSPSGNVTVTSGNSQTFTINPGACNTIADVLVDGVSVLGSVVNNTYTFTNVTSDHTFQVLYNSANFNLSASTNGNGNVNPVNATVACGASQIFSITPNAGYVIDYVTDNTVVVTSQVINNSYTLSNITADHQIYVAFTESTTPPSDTYTITVTTDGNATATPSNASVAAGSNVGISIVPNSGYRLLAVTDNGADVTTLVSDNTYNLLNINENHSINVTCELENSIASYTSGTITLFPNPAADVVNIASVQMMESVTIFDISGRIVYQSDAAATQLAVRIADLTAGVYLVRAVTADGMVTMKLLKK